MTLDDTGIGGIDAEKRWINKRGCAEGRGEDTGRKETQGETMVPKYRKRRGTWEVGEEERKEKSGQRDGGGKSPFWLLREKREEGRGQIYGRLLG